MKLVLLHLSEHDLRNSIWITSEATDERSVLINDRGGGTFDGSILNI